MTDYNDGLWHGWNGDECPLHPKTIVKVLGRYDDSHEGSAGEYVYWPNVAAFRVVKEYKKPREITVDGVKFREVLE